MGEILNWKAFGSPNICYTLYVLQTSENPGIPRFHPVDDAYRGGIAFFGEITLLKGYRIGLVTGALRTTAFPQELAGRAGKFADRLLLPPAAEYHVSLR